MLNEKWFPFLGSRKGRYHYLHFTDEKAEVQSDKVTCPNSHKYMIRALTGAFLFLAHFVAHEAHKSFLAHMKSNDYTVDNCTECVYHVTWGWHLLSCICCFFVTLSFLSAWASHALWALCSRGICLSGGYSVSAFPLTDFQVFANPPSSLEHSSTLNS